jgi:hypothetical protein
MSRKKKGGKRIFLSYAIADRDAARRVQKAFSRYAGVRVFASETLRAGENWQVKLRGEIASSSVFVLLLSSKTLESDLIKWEIGVSWAFEKPLVIVQAHPGVEASLPVDLTPAYLVNIEDCEEPDVVRQILELNGAVSNAAST